MYDKCYFCLDQLPKLKKESTASLFINFGRSRGTKEPTYITVDILDILFIAGQIPHIMVPFPPDVWCTSHNTLLDDDSNNAYDYGNDDLDERLSSAICH